MLNVNAIEMKFAFLTKQLDFPNKVIKNEKLCIMMYGCYGIFFFCCLEFYKFVNTEKFDGEIVI